MTERQEARRSVMEGIPLRNLGGHVSYVMVLYLFEWTVRSVISLVLLLGCFNF